ncbi:MULTISPECIES: transposase [unclassified Streptomyces]|uniref:transposase n=1 Tax=unclassified Streptomyces TaxID=2593676 RepID=UPI00386F0434
MFPLLASRGIERRGRENVAFRAICAHQAPRRRTIARFRVRHPEALAHLFGQVLGLCAEAGLVEVAVLAVDGSKFEASAPSRGVMRDGRRSGPERPRGPALCGSQSARGVLPARWNPIRRARAAKPSSVPGHWARTASIPDRRTTERRASHLPKRSRSASDSSTSA